MDGAMRLLGAVLAGGESRRFGSDKAMALLDDRALIAHALDALAAQTDAAIVVGRDWAVVDRPPGGLGPLAGINAALCYAHLCGYDAVLTCACDTPRLPPNLSELLAGGGYLAEMPVIGLWPVALFRSLDAYIGDDEIDDLSVRGWAAWAGVRRVMLGAPVANINTPAELEAFRRGPAG